MASSRDAHPIPIHSIKSKSLGNKTSFKNINKLFIWINLNQQQQQQKIYHSFSSQEYISGLQAALSNYEGGLRSFHIPCYISEAASEEYDPTERLKYQ